MNITSKIKGLFRIIKGYKDWPHFLLSYYGLSKKKNTTFTFRNGIVWNVDTTKKNFGVINDVRFEKPLKLLYSLKNPKVIIDGGAHIGAVSILAAKLYPNAKIYSIEPDNENFLLLKKNISDNKCRNIKAFNLALNDYDGKATFNISENTSGQSSLKKIEYSKPIIVNCEKISTFMKKLKINVCDVLKLNVERADFIIIKSIIDDGIINKFDSFIIVFKSDEELLRVKKLFEKYSFKVDVLRRILFAKRK